MVFWLLHSQSSHKELWFLKVLRKIDLHFWINWYLLNIFQCFPQLLHINLSEEYMKLYYLKIKFRIQENHIHHWCYYFVRVVSCFLLLIFKGFYFQKCFIFKLLHYCSTPVLSRRLKLYFCPINFNFFVAIAFLKSHLFTIC